MAISFMKGLGFALKGGLEAAGELAQAEDKRREELSKEALASVLKRQETALAAAQKLREKSQAQQEWMETYGGQTFGNATMSKAEALRLYNITGGDHTKVKDAIEDGLIKITGAGTVTEVKGGKQGGADADAVKGVIGESKSLFGEGRAESVASKVQEGLTARGMSPEGIEMPTTFKESGVSVGAIGVDKEGDEFKTLKWGWVDIPDGKGGFTRVQGAQETSGKGRWIIKDPETGENMPAPPGSVFTPQSTRTTTDATLSEAVNDLSGFLNKSSRDRMDAVIDASKSHEMLVSNYNTLAPLALDYRNYSRIAGIVGSISKGIEVEVAGLRLLTGTDDQTQRDEKYFTDTLATLDEKISTLSQAQDVASNRNLMEAMALRMAINDLVSSGDSRPSDFDVRKRLEMYLATSPEAFVKQAQQNLGNVNEQYTANVNALGKDGGFNTLKGITTRPEANEMEKTAAQLLLEAYTTSTETMLQKPEFLTQYEAGELQLEEAPKPAPKEQGIKTKVTLSTGREIDASYDPLSGSFTLNLPSGETATVTEAQMIQRKLISAEEIQKLLRSK